MKLYTEEQVREAIKFAQISSNVFSTPLMYNKDDVIAKLTPIELPSDDEIEKSYPYCFQFTDDHHFGNKDCFKEGAKWMKEQILTQNK